MKKKKEEFAVETVTLTHRDRDTHTYIASSLPVDATPSSRPERRVQTDGAEACPVPYTDPAQARGGTVYNRAIDDIGRTVGGSSDERFRRLL